LAPSELGVLHKPIGWVIVATLFLVGRVRIVVYANDHPPPHVHAVNDGHARFALGETPADVHLVECERMSRRELRSIAEAIIARHDECLASWRMIHGR
jgi:hypothetical protein